MPKDIVIIGAGGLGREVLWFLEELNSRDNHWNIKGFIDDNPELQNQIVNGYPVIGTVESLYNYTERTAAACCIAKPEIRQRLITKLKQNTNIEFPNIIAANVRYSDRVEFGTGNVICQSVSMTVDIKIGDFNIINPSCTIGHDVVVGDYVTLYPSVNVSGNVHLSKQIEIGTGSQIIQGLTICEDVIVGAGGVVVRDITKSGTYVGVPVKQLLK